MAVAVSDMIAQVRLKSGLRGNRLWSDSEIATALTDGYKDLRDRMIVRFAHWFAARYPFTLVGGVGASTLDLSLVPRLEMIQGLDLLVGGIRYTVNELGSFAERNAYNGSTLFGSIGPAFNGFAGRRYFPNGDEMELLPPQNAGGDYELIYTPMALELKPPVTLSPLPYSRSIAHSIVSGPHGVDGTTNIQRINLANGNFTSRDDNGTLVIAASGTAADGTYTLTDVFDDTQIEVTPLPGPDLVFGVSTTALLTDLSVSATGVWTFADLGAIAAGDTLIVSGAANAGNNGSFTVLTVGDNHLTTAITGLVNETFDADVSVTYQPDGSISSLPQPLTPWAEYPVLYASIVIKAEREQDTRALDVQFAMLKDRVTALTKQRSEGVQQAPIVRSWRGGGPGGWGYGGV